MTEHFSFEPRLQKAANEADRRIGPRLAQIDEVARRNTRRVLNAFIENRVSEPMFAGSTGYGYGDRGRDTLDRVFADGLGAEDALARPQFISGTHAIATALFGVLRPGDVLLSCTGKPYDTLDEVIGLRGGGMGSLRDFGVRFEQTELRADGSVDLEALKERLSRSPVRAVYLQRSRGYSLRPALPVDALGAAARLTHGVSPGTLVLVDNCYGEFVEPDEPTARGADLIAGSLIKNPGGGLARTGGYVAGRKDLVEAASYRLGCPGIGRDAGPTLGSLREMYQGFFVAPHVVAQALKTAVFASALFELLGFEVSPRWDEPRSDIVQSIKFGTAERLCAFCRGIQMGSPVDSFVTPEPWDMPGYDSKVVMAAGAFTMGASIELSADGPLRPPYAVWMQGGLTYECGRDGVLLAARQMLRP